MQNEETKKEYIQLINNRNELQLLINRLSDDFPIIAKSKLIDALEILTTILETEEKYKYIY